MSKRIMDFLFVILVSPLWIPILILVGLMIRLRLGKPVFFCQERPGLNCRLFKMVKFRSMINQSGPNGIILPDDQRLTPFGRWLRSTSLDELPEIFNVLKGEMSLVGPRPLLVKYLRRYNLREMGRHDMPPGITGWAQVNGRNHLSWLEKFELDLWYVQNAGLRLDLWILCKTVLIVIRRDGISAKGDPTMPEFLGNSLDSDIKNPND